MLEYHSRLHYLDVKRQKQQQRKQEAAAAAAAAARPRSSSNSSGAASIHHPMMQPADTGSAAAAAAAADAEHQHEAGRLASEHEPAEQLDDSCCNDAASDVQVSALMHNWTTRCMLFGLSALTRKLHVQLWPDTKLFAQQRSWCL
jgi:type IV secretory pathway VirJ component